MNAPDHRRAIVVGAGGLGLQAAAALAESGNDVTVVEIDPGRAATAAAGTTARMVTGDGCEPYVLEEAGILNAGLLIATTWDDEDNLVISLLAKRQYRVSQVVARVNDSENAWLFDERWGVDAAVPSAAPILSLIEEASGTTGTVGLLRLGKAGVDLVETVIGADSPAAGRPLADFPLPGRSVVAAVIRDSTTIIPDTGFRLHPGDELLILTQDTTQPAITATFR